jgi:gluconolactonase
MQVEAVRLIHFDHYTEGPVTDNLGNTYCTTLTGGSILRIDPNDNYSVWATSRCPNGQIILSNGDHLVCDSASASVVRYDRDGNFIRNQIQAICAGKKVSVPNDVIVDSAEGIYFTDSIRHNGNVFYQSQNGVQRLVASGLDYPNGLALSHDEKKLFVAESYKNRIIAINIKAPAVFDNAYTVVAGLPVHHSGNETSNLPDGIAIDENSFIWIAHYGMQAIQVIDSGGKIIHSIEMPFPLVSNVCFSDTSRTELIVTGGFNEPGPGAVARLTIKY